jgi:hypothetical protein
LCLHFRFVLYRRKTVGTKVARRTLVKLTPDLISSNKVMASSSVVHSLHFNQFLKLFSGVNFTNILTCSFSIQKVLREAFLYLHFMFEFSLEQEYWRKCAHKILVKLTSYIFKLLLSGHLN